MADITNLESFLKDVAGAIKTKKGTTALIPAAKFDEEIASITTGEGVDTSDATATAEELLINKTAYVNGKKITGTAEDIRDGHMEAAIFDVHNDDELGIIHTSSAYPPSATTALMNANTFYEVDIKHNVMANAIGLTADKLVKGNTILGVKGTASAGGSTELGEYSATFISDKPFEDGSNVKVLYTNDENKLDAIPEPAPFSGRFDGYNDITTSAWGSFVNITTGTIFTANKVYRASNTLGYIYTYIIKEEDRDKCSFSETNDYEMTSDLLLSGVEIAPPEIVVNEGYIYAGWMYNNNVAVIPIWVRGSATINPIILEETDDILQVTFIPDRDRGGFQYNWGSAIYSNESVYTYGLAGMFGVKDTTDPGTSLAGWESITLTFKKSEFEMSGATTLEVLTGDSSAYGFGSINIYDVETDTEVDFLDAMVAFSLVNLSHGKTYKISGSIGM